MPIIKVTSKIVRISATVIHKHAAFLKFAMFGSTDEISINSVIYFV